MRDDQCFISIRPCIWICAATGPGSVSRPPKVGVGSAPTWRPAAATRVFRISSGAASASAAAASAAAASAASASTAAAALAAAAAASAAAACVSTLSESRRRVPGPERRGTLQPRRGSPLTSPAAALLFLRTASPVASLSATGRPSARPCTAAPTLRLWSAGPRPCASAASSEGCASEGCVREWTERGV